MLMRSTILMAAIGLLLTTGCRKDAASSPPPAGPTGEPAPTETPAERPALTNTECEGKGGTVVGDIGDGAVHRPDYRCENGQPPIGSIRAEGDGPVAIEGAVCCLAAAE